jgi:UDP:flavonoid glycosyltransferase YjiC (YdhE family)
MRSHDKPVILFVAEAVTLAHFARIVALARSLEASSYQIVVASDPRYLNLDRSFNYQFHPIWSLPSDEFARSLARGKPLYDAGTLTRYVEDDLALLDTVKPDLVIGDFRLSLAVSAPLRKVPYAAVVNAYWSPYAEIPYPVPDLPFTRFTGLSLGQKLFDFVYPFAFALHSRPLNRVRRDYGLASLGDDLRKTYTWGDYTLYADIPELVPMRLLPDNHRFLGPILWSTQTQLPEWWDSLPDDKPVVFVTLGSSGRADLLPLVIKVLSELPVTIIAATAGKIALENLPPSVFVADYLPMDIASQRADLVIGNGGSLTTYQALAHGVPVIGICSNMDQLLNMSALEKLGVGITLRAGRMGGEILLHKAAIGALEAPAYRQAATALAQLLRQYQGETRFGNWIREILG